MQGSLAQQIALKTYGNAYLSGVPGVDWKFFPSNTTFSFCEYVRFVDRNTGEAGAKAFDNGRAALDGKPLDAVGYDLAPDAILTPDARHLLAAVQASWVFGGMGSWNDVGFEGADREIYLRSSQELHRALNEAVIVAANVCSPSRGESPIL